MKRSSTLRVRLNIVGSHSGRQHLKRDASEKINAQGESNVCASSEVQPAIQCDRMNLNIIGSLSGRQHSKGDASEKKNKKKAQGESNVCASSEMEPAIQASGGCVRRFHGCALLPRRASGLRGYEGGFK